MRLRRPLAFVASEPAQIILSLVGADGVRRSLRLTAAEAEQMGLKINVALAAAEAGADRASGALDGTRKKASGANVVFDATAQIVGDLAASRFPLLGKAVAASGVGFEGLLSSGKSFVQSAGGVRAALGGIAAALGGPLGITALLALAAAAVYTFADDIAEALGFAQNEFALTRDEVASLSASFLNIDLPNLSLDIDSVEDAEAEAAALTDRLAKLKDEEKALLNQTNPLDRVLGRTAQRMAILANGSEESRRAVEALGNDIAGTESRLDALNQALAEYALSAELAAGRQRPLSLDGFGPASGLGAQSDADRERDREAERARETAAREAQRAQAKAVRDAERERDRAARAAQRDARKREREAARDARELARARAQATLEVIADRYDRELEAARRTYRERQAMAAGNADALEEIELAYNVRTVQIEHERREARLQVVARTARAETALAERALGSAVDQAELRLETERQVLAETERLVGTGGEAYADQARRVEAAALDLRDARLRAAREAADEEARIDERRADARAEMLRRQRDVQVRTLLAEGATEAEATAFYLESLRREADAAQTTAERKMELEREITDVKIAEAERQRRAQEAVLQDLLRTAGDELTRELEYDAERIASTEARLADERAAIEDDLAEQLITYDEAAKARAALDAEEAEFRKAVAEDERDTLGALADQTTALVRAAAEEAIAAKLAEYAVSYFEAATEFFGFLGPFAPAAALATVPAALAVANSVIPAFERGGLVRGGEQVIRINEAGEEFVVNAQATRGNERELAELQAMLAAGVPLRSLLPPAAGRAPAPSSRHPSSGDGRALVSEIRAMRAELRGQTATLDRSNREGAERVAQTYADPSRARRQERVARRRERLVSPTRRTL